MPNTPLTPDDIRAPFGNYSHGVIVPPGARLLVTSGQLGIDHDGNIPEEIEEQAILCFEAIGAILRAGDMGFEHVVKFSAFVTSRAFFPAYMAVRDRYVGTQLPSSTLVIVSGFTRPEFKVEIEALAARSD